MESIGTAAAPVPVSFDGSAEEVKDVEKSEESAPPKAEPKDQAETTEMPTEENEPPNPSQEVQDAPQSEEKQTNEAEEEPGVAGIGDAMDLDAKPEEKEEKEPDAAEDAGNGAAANGSIGGEEQRESEVQEEGGVEEEEEEEEAVEEEAAAEEEEGDEEEGEAADGQRRRTTRRPVAQDGEEEEDKEDEPEMGLAGRRSRRTIIKRTRDEDEAEADAPARRKRRSNEDDEDEEQEEAKGEEEIGVASSRTRRPAATRSNDQRSSRNSAHASSSQSRAISRQPASGLENGTVTRRLAEVVKKESLPKADHAVYAPGVSVSTLCESKSGMVQVRIPAKFLCYNNRQLRRHFLWGTDVYTDESDLVAVIAHMGKFCPSWNPPLLHMLVLDLKIAPANSAFVGSVRFGVHSRSLTSYTGCSIKVERCVVLKSINSELPSESNNLANRSALGSLAGHYDTPPTMQWPVDQTLLVQFSLSNDPWQRYQLWVVADQGPERKLWTSYRLKNLVLFAETFSARYELSMSDSSGEFAKYRWARFNDPANMDGAVMQTATIPLDDAHVTVTEAGLDWEEIRWGHNKVQVRGTTYPLTRILWYPISKAKGAIEA